jgi:predicted GIY-YIG superfamily endonuclease
MYKESKIYKIICYDTELCYIGSTTQPLHKRFYQHKSAYKIWEVWSKYVSSFTRKNKKFNIPTADEAQKILKEIYKNDNSL